MSHDFIWTIPFEYIWFLLVIMRRFAKHLYLYVSFSSFRKPTSEDKYLEDLEENYHYAYGLHNNKHLKNLK